jgi:hypothetical protein
MKYSRLAAFILICNGLILFLVLTEVIKGNAFGEFTHGELTFFFFIQLLNFLSFMYSILYNVAIHNSSRNTYSISKEDEIFNEKVSKIVRQIITEEIKTESLKNSEDLKIKVLIHEAKTRAGIRELNEQKKRIR